MTEKKTRDDNKLTEEQVRLIETKFQHKLMGKISMAVSSSRTVAYHDKIQILREIRAAIGNDVPD